MSQIQELLSPLFATISSHLTYDPDFQACTSQTRCTFALSSSDNPQASVIVGVDHGHAAFSPGPAHAAIFGIQLRPVDWSAFFAPHLVRPYQSIWGILRTIGDKPGIAVLGDEHAFGQHARIWRLVLDRARDAMYERPPPNLEPASDDEGDEPIDAVAGAYVWLRTRSFGRVKVFHERAGTGPQSLLFLHTAGSDGRQFHALMNDAALQARCSMVAFDLPGHGRSGLGTRQNPGGYTLTEEGYVEVIGAVSTRLGLQGAIVCGASMAGHACLAVAMRARELGVRGAIPCSACAHIARPGTAYRVRGTDDAVLHPEQVGGLCAPDSPVENTRQIWWQYSSQGWGIFEGDLGFYFGGWDGRGRVEEIDMDVCPVYMLTGEYDYSCTTDMSRETAERIPGARFEAMEGLGHFPMTESPPAMMPYLLRAIDWIQGRRKDG